ncbi:hypothetical protein M758_8G105300 [Ceratodon purpureus]|nr:hypothetical protein M758_8G105300 [Ceratodon purpureus]
MVGNRRRDHGIVAKNTTKHNQKHKKNTTLLLQSFQATFLRRGYTPTSPEPRPNVSRASATFCRSCPERAQSDLGSKFLRGAPPEPEPSLNRGGAWSEEGSGCRLGK